MRLRKKDIEYEQISLNRDIKLYKSELDSCFEPTQMLDNKYFLISIIGKGGFSEVKYLNHDKVWLAMDQTTLSYVACKIHQLDISFLSQKNQINK